MLKKIPRGLPDTNDRFSAPPVLGLAAQRRCPLLCRTLWGPSVHTTPLVRTPVSRGPSIPHNPAGTCTSSTCSRVAPRLCRPPRAFFGCVGPRSHRGYTRIFLSLGFALLGHRGYTSHLPRGSQCFSHRSIPGAVTPWTTEVTAVLLRPAVLGDFAPLSTQNAPGHLKSHPCNTWWREVKRTVPTSLPLCPSQGVSSPTLHKRLWPGAQWDCRCTGTKGQCLVYGVTGRQGERDEATAIAISPRPPGEAQGRLRSSGCASSRTRGILVPVKSNTRRTEKRQYVDHRALLARDETRWLAGPASHNGRRKQNDVENT